MERKLFLRNSIGLLSTATLIDACKKTGSTTGSGSASITALNCSGATVAAAVAASAYSGTATVPYTGGNGVAYSAAAAVASTGVTGLSATLLSGTLASGTGNLIYMITGTPAAAGTAVFALSFGGQSCSLSVAVNAAGSAASCIVAVSETEGPYPYPGGELTNPLNRSDVRVISGTTLKTGVQLALAFTVVNTNSSCAPVSGVRVDIWHCDARGYYSGYSGQPGVDGTLSYTGQTWLRGYQVSGADGVAAFTTIYPGWYGGRATHIHFEVFIGGVMKKTGQITFLESVSDAIHVTSGYNGTVNPVRNASDSVFGDSATDLSHEYAALSGSIAAGYTGTYTIGLAL